MSKEEPHRFQKLKNFKWMVCGRCDLVLLKNEKTEKAIKKPCIGQYVKVDVPAHLRTKIDH